MKILHTSDWHLGQTLYAKKDRHEEHKAFFQWLLKTLRDEQIDILLVAGDVFDTAFPNHASQKMYYDFLIEAVRGGCRQVIVIGGNHDSPSFLNAPADVLAALNIKVVGSITANLQDEIIEIQGKDGALEAIVCAVPFLRERDISRFVEEENYTDRTHRINENIQRHYQTLARLTEEKRMTAGKWVPVIATGHLSVLGGLRAEDDGVRETYIGNIEALTPEIFPKSFDYVALGHFHLPKIINDRIRYSGSPIPMGFAELSKAKCVYIIQFSNKSTQIKSLEIPLFQPMHTLIGDLSTLENQLKELIDTKPKIWVEIVYTGEVLITDLAKRLHHFVEKSNVEIISIKNPKYISGLLTSDKTHQTLENLNEQDVFQNLLKKNNIPETQQQELTELYNEILESLSNPENN